MEAQVWVGAACASKGTHNIIKISSQLLMGELMGRTPFLGLTQLVVELPLEGLRVGIVSGGKETPEGNELTISFKTIDFRKTHDIFGENRRADHGLLAEQERPGDHQGRRIASARSFCAEFGISFALPRTRTHQRHLQSSRYSSMRRATCGTALMCRSRTSLSGTTRFGFRSTAM